MRLGLVIFAGVALLGLAGAAAAADADFRITLQAGAEPRFEGTSASGVLVEEAAGEHLAWNLTSAKPQLLGVVVADGYFAVARPEQVYPGIDPHYDLHDAPLDEVMAADHGTRLVNATRDATGLTMWLTFPVGENQTLALTRDVEPPGFTIGPVQNLTDHSLYLETTTTEYARADLQLQPAEGGDVVRNPTAQSALLQRFPITGLRPDTSYTAWLEVWDWSGNRARSANFTFHTLPKPVLPAPVIGALEPAPGATLNAPVSFLAVNFSGPAPREGEGVAVFVDATAVRQGLTLLPGRLEVRLATPLGPGPHRVGVELTSAEGGMSEARWSFTVRGAGAPGLSGAETLLAAGLVAVGLALSRRR